jgi:uncharacterized OB-fold protein
MRLQRCTACGTALYPPREICAVCLSDQFAWDAEGDAEGEVLAETVLHHSHEPAMRPKLPLRIGLVRLAAGPTVLCFLADCAAGDRVRVAADGQGLLTATRAEG